ncbi:MAG TPA: hypothetical protein VLJ21_04185 [Candidatus Binatia bacterium]|nr:hypothetical protein [Candidatus Binatia bacterium]
METSFIDGTLPVSRDEARGILAKLSEKPMTMPLVKLFCRASDEKSYVKTKNGRLGLYGAPNISGIYSSLSIQQCHENVLMHFHPCKLEHLEREDERAGYYDLACIYTGPKTTGIWCYGKGDQMAHGVSLELKRELLLPSKEVRWLFDHLSWFATIMGEHLSLREQPKFWTGDKERP